jgi:hypothetical protein
MREGVRGVHPSVHAAYQAHKEESGVSPTALSHQLDRVATAVAAALVRDAARRAAPGGQALHASHPQWLPGSVTQGLDGQPWASTDQRRQAWRGTWAAPRPGPALVGWAQPHLVIPDGISTEDGPAQERRVMDPGLSRVCAGDLWIADRPVCPLGLMCGLARRGAACLVRQPGPLQGLWLGAPRRPGVTRSGTVSAPAMRGPDPARGDAMHRRRIPLRLKEPTRDGAPALPLLSNGPAAEARAGQLAVLDGKRWRIETAFFASTTTRSCAMQTLGYPKAAWLACWLALVVSNAVAVMQAA